MAIRVEVRSSGERKLPLTAEDARRAVRSLDGHTTTDMELERDGYGLAISCGPDKFAVAYTTPDDGYSLVTDREAKGTETRIWGGVWTDLPSFSLVCRDAAEKAAVEFAETGRIKLTSDWLDGDEFHRLEEANA